MFDFELTADDTMVIERPSIHGGLLETVLEEDAASYVAVGGLDVPVGGEEDQPVSRSEC